jgi:hypothetical protein
VSWSLPVSAPIYQHRYTPKTALENNNKNSLFRPICTTTLFFTQTAALWVRTRESIGSESKYSTEEANINQAKTLWRKGAKKTEPF